MNIRVNCDSCSGTITVPDKFLGKRIKCPECGEPVLVQEDDFEDEAPQRKTARKSSAGKKKRGKAESGSMSPLLIGGGVCAAVFGIGLTAIFMMKSGNSPQAAVGKNDSVSPPGVVASNPVVSNPAVAPPVTPQPAPAQPAVSQVAPAQTTPQTAPAQPAIAEPVAPQPAAQSASASPAKPDKVAAKPEAALRDVTKYMANDAERQKKLTGVELIKKVEPAVVKVYAKTPKGSGHGSGSLIDASGIVVTNAHVMENGLESDVEFADGRTAKVTGFYSIDFFREICIIQIDLPVEKVKSTIKYLPRMVEKAEPVMAFGSPLGLDFTVSQGQVSALRPRDEMKKMVGRPSILGDWVQTTTPISGGNSGGPLVDHYGNIVGMNTLGSNGGSAQNLNFAISSVDILDSLSRRPDKPEPVNPGRLKRPDEAKNAFRSSPGRSIRQVGFSFDSGWPSVVSESRANWFYERFPLPFFSQTRSN